MKKLTAMIFILAFSACAHSQTINQKLSTDCSSPKGDGVKIYTDKSLTHATGEYSPDDHGFTPSSQFFEHGTLVYKGSIYFSRNGRDEPGTFYIKASEWQCN